MKIIDTLVLNVSNNVLQSIFQARLISFNILQVCQILLSICILETKSNDI